jgi:hypothetical protein
MGLHCEHCPRRPLIDVRNTDIEVRATMFTADLFFRNQGLRRRIPSLRYNLLDVLTGLSIISVALLTPSHQAGPIFQPCIPVLVLERVQCTTTKMPFGIVPLGPNLWKGFVQLISLLNTGHSRIILTVWCLGRCLHSFGLGLGITFVEALLPIFARRSNSIMTAGFWKAEERWCASTRARERKWLTGKGYLSSDMRSVRIEVLLFSRLVSLWRFSRSRRHNVDLLSSSDKHQSYTSWCCPM